MKFAVTGADRKKAGCIAAFIDAHRWEAWPFDLASDFASFLFRDPEVAGVLVADDHVAACDALIEWRRADLRAPILVLLSDRRHGPADLARIIMAGADDAQHLSAAPEEIAARMYRLTRRYEVVPASAAIDVAIEGLREIACQAADESRTPIIVSKLRA